MVVRATLPRTPYSQGGALDLLNLVEKPSIEELGSWCLFFQVSDSHVHFWSDMTNYLRYSTFHEIQLSKAVNFCARYILWRPQYRKSRC